MRMKTFLGWLGVIVVGAGIFVLLKSQRKDEKHGEAAAVAATAAADAADASADTSEELAADTIEEITADTICEKQKSADTISSRHKAARDEIKQSVNNIFKESDLSEDIPTKNDQELNNLFDDLNNL